MFWNFQRYYSILSETTVNSLCKAWWSTYFSWLHVSHSRDGGVFRFQVSVTSGTHFICFTARQAPLFTLPRTEFWNDKRIFLSTGRAPHAWDKNKFTSGVTNTTRRQPAQISLYTTIKSGSSDNLLFYCIFIWYHLSVVFFLCSQSGTISDMRTWNHTNKIKVKVVTAARTRFTNVGAGATTLWPKVLGLL